ncbi:MAG: AAA family ATPase [Anaerococcus vaginalis]|uniref:ParA family protein n=1 Tax=Anaerococcus vaginalis TaxID=33037 RepID=UPI0029104260|nr:AAA family ATPase [Anaerococcus vaginalis]MDU4446607.1 AAA family ATPase [Anaerococcus vaginalis]MDU6182292.1 AAA family ATPase [Anaerococcus vaginalis]MDU7433305.1 AAA family ATPase [Anaerococcus vaginalis]
MKTISIFNQKGGVGKTTSVVNLAVSLSKLDKKVLVIDFDPQANTTTGLGFDKNELEKSIYKMFYDEGDNYKDYILKSEEGPYLIASENSLSGLEVELVSLDEEERLKMLSQIIEEIKKDFDIILIDCPPSLGLLSLNALVASDSIIIPIQTEYYALEGVSELLKTYQTIKESIKEDLEIEGVLLCMFDKDTDLSYEVVEEVKSFFKEKVFSTMIPRNIKLAEAPSFGKSVISYDEKSKGARAYLSLGNELVENIFGKKENLEKNSKIEEKNDKLNNAEIKNSEKTKEIRDEKSKEDKNIVKNDKKENSDETIVKKNKFSFNQNKLINNEKRD